MAEDKTAGRPVGATGTTVRKNIRRIRDALGVSAPELSSRLETVGRPIPPLGISRIENGSRRVDVDDLVAISVVLGVSPSTLLMPARSDSDDPIDAKDLVVTTGWHVPMSAKALWDWLIAAEPLFGDSDMTAFVNRSWPIWERRRWDAQLREMARRNRDELFRSVRGDRGDD